MSDNEDTLASLGHGTRVAVHANVLSVKDPVGPPIPEVFQPPEEGAERPSSVLRQDTGHVLPHDPARRTCADQSEKLQREASSSVGQPLSESGDGERLAWGAPDEEVDGSIPMNRVSWVDELREVAMIRHLWVMVLEHRTREGFDLAEPRGRPPERLPRDGRGLDA